MKATNNILIVSSFVAAVANSAAAAVSPEQAKLLGGSTLTEFGAERAGNADGSIPAYTGGLTSAPAGLAQTGNFLADPYAADKVLYSVDSKNLSQYSDKVTAGTAEMIKRYPGFRVDVYPTRRSAAYPAYVLQNTLKNATSAVLVGDVKGDGVKGAYGGIPFPIPSNGNEVMWNAVLHWQGIWVKAKGGAGIFVDRIGHRTLTEVSETDSAYYYYDPLRHNLPDEFTQKSLIYVSAPAAEDGLMELIMYPINYGDRDSTSYLYTVGQRRVRLAPEFKYDTPVAQSGGAIVYDEFNMFAGRQDRFDFKLLGKKEVIVPYNSFKLNQPTVSEASLLTPTYVSPDYTRWEKHRCWIVEATLKAGKRHIYSRRTFYVDEDSWSLVAAESYDQGGRLYRVGFTPSFPVYTAANPFLFSTTFLFYNLEAVSYSYTSWFGGQYDGSVVGYEKLPNPSTFSPETMAGTGLR